jgi:hypothetical protein
LELPEDEMQRCSVLLGTISFAEFDNPVCRRPRDQFVARLAHVRLGGLSSILLTSVGTDR